MTILALETATRAGSAALLRDGGLVAASEGEASRPHGERLPQDLLRLLAAHGLTLPEVDVLAVASGPGSFTSVRVGVATVQGLALAHGRPVVPVPTLDAVARGLSEAVAGESLLAAWMDGQRGEVFAALYARGPEGARALTPPLAGAAEAVLDAWTERLADRRVAFGGDAVDASRSLLLARIGARAELAGRIGPLAPIVARLAAERAGRGETVAPHGVEPVYVRRPDAEIARDRRRAVDPPAP